MILLSLGLAWLLARSDTFNKFELASLDYRFRLRGPNSVEDSPIIILAIDDQSDASTPHRWPWPRSYFAHVIENLNQAGVKAIGVDVLFDHSDFENPGSDQVLADMLQRYDNVVLAGKIERLSRFHGMSIKPPADVFMHAGTPWGLVSSEVDIDGITRRYLLAQSYRDSTYSSFALEIFKLVAGLDSTTPLTDNGDHYSLDKWIIPKYDSYSMLINFAGGAYTFPIYPFDNVLDDEDFDLIEPYDLNAFEDPGDIELGIPPGLLHSGILKDKIVLIGSTMQELHDNFPTPYLVSRSTDGTLKKELTPGVESHANVINNLLSRQFYRHPPEAAGYVVFLVLIILLYGLGRLSPLLGGIGVIVTGFVYLCAAIIIFNRQMIIFPVSFPLLFIFMGFAGQTLYQYAVSIKEKWMIHQAFTHYVPEKVVSEILADPSKLTLGGEERVVTVLFSDIVGFTSIAEKMKPVHLVALLNEYLSEMSDIILANNGIIDKFEGDAIMAEFGMPVYSGNHAFQACMAALEMQARLKELREKWAAEGRPQIYVRIGINTGEVIVGNLGSKTVFDYTVLGDSVNLGARLETANKTYGTEILISENSYAEVKNDIVFRMLDNVLVMGKNEPIRIFEPICHNDTPLSDEMQQLLPLFEKGFHSYQQQQWEIAKAHFMQCLKINAHDRPSMTYLIRCQDFQNNPPAKDWDGVWIMQTK